MALFRAHPEGVCKRPLRPWMEKRATVAQRCFSKDPPPSLPLGNTARRAQGLCTSLLPLVGASFRLPADSGRSAGFLRAPPPPEWGVGGHKSPPGSGSAPNLRGQRPTSYTSASCSRGRREWVILSRPRRAAGSPPSSLSLATPSRGASTGRHRPPAPTRQGRPADLARGPRT